MGTQGKLQTADLAVAALADLNVPVWRRLSDFSSAPRMVGIDRDFIFACVLDGNGNVFRRFNGGLESILLSSLGYNVTDLWSPLTILSQCFACGFDGSGPRVDTFSGLNTTDFTNIGSTATILDNLTTVTGFSGTIANVKLQAIHARDDKCVVLGVETGAPDKVVLWEFDNTNWVDRTPTNITLPPFTVAQNIKKVFDISTVISLLASGDWYIKLNDTVFRIFDSAGTPTAQQIDSTRQNKITAFDKGYPVKGQLVVAWDDAGVNKISFINTATDISVTGNWTDKTLNEAWDTTKKITDITQFTNGTNWIFVGEDTRGYMFIENQAISVGNMQFEVYSNQSFAGLDGLNFTFAGGLKEFIVITRGTSATFLKRFSGTGLGVEANDIADKSILARKFLDFGVGVANTAVTGRNFGTSNFMVILEFTANPGSTGWSTSGKSSSGFTIDAQNNSAFSYVVLSKDS